MVRKLMWALWLPIIMVTSANAASVWQAASFGVGGSGVWVDEGGAPAFRDVEGVGTAAVSLTPHISVVGAVAYGVDRSYVRGSGGVRLTATDVNNPDFSVGVGVSRHYVSEPESGLDEAAAEAVVGWKPLAQSKWILGGSAVYGLDTGRRRFSVSLIWPFKLVDGGAQ